MKSKRTIKSKKKKGGNMINYPGYCADTDQCRNSHTNSCNTTQKGGNMINYPGYCADTDQCRNSYTNSCNTTQKGGKLLSKKNLKAGYMNDQGLSCGDVVVYPEFCHKEMSQCCPSVPCTTNGGKKNLKRKLKKNKTKKSKNIKNKGGSYDGILSQLHANDSYSSSIEKVQQYNKNIAKRLDIPCFQNGGGVGAAIQLSASSPSPITPNSLVEYTYDIMKGMSSNEKPLSWTTNFKNANEAIEVVKKNTIFRDKTIQESLQKN